jgi:hypothetical protein
VAEAVGRVHQSPMAVEVRESAPMAVEVRESAPTGHSKKQT